MTRISKNILGLGSVLTLAVGLTSSALAGPSPQFWQQQEQIRAENAAKARAAAPAAKPIDTPAMACPTCKTKIYVDDASPNPIDRTRPRIAKIGTRHTCASCSGTVTLLHGLVTDEMKHNHATCPTISCCTPPPHAPNT